MKKLLRKWLGVDFDRSEVIRIEHELESLRQSLSGNGKYATQMRDTQAEIGRTQKFIGAIFDYLGVRPQWTFVEDFSRLPDEAIPTMEVIQVKKIAKKKNL